MVLHLQEQKIKILCFGWYNKGNCGDESYKVSFSKLFNNCDIDFVDRINPNECQKYDLIILGGGNIVDKPYLRELNKIKNKDIYAFSVGVPNKIDIEDLSKIKHIYVRDIKSKEYLEKIGYLNTTFCPDAAFCFEPDPIRGKQLVKDLFIGRDLYEKKIAITINSYLLGGREELARDSITFQKFSMEMSSIIDNTNASFIFLPFSITEPRDDRVSNSWIASKCKYWKKNKVVYDKLDYKDVLDIISYTDVSINTRLHVSIFSLVSEKPFIDITHHSKNLGFLKTIDAENLSIDYWHFNFYEMKELLNKILNNSIDVSFIKDKSQFMKDRLKWCLNDLHFNKR